jgi:hypothetical protein
MYNYLFQGKIVTADTEQVENISTSFNHQSHKLVPLSAEQVAFHEANPTCTLAEMWNCELFIEPVVEKTPADLRKEAYIASVELRASIDAYVSYQIEGNEAGMEEARLEILAIKESIRLQYPDEL